MKWRESITDPNSPTAHRLSSVGNELREILKSVPENRADPATMRMRYELEQAARFTKRAQDSCTDIALTPLSGRAIGWDDL